MSGGARPKPLLSVAEAARELLGVAPTTAYEWARRGELPGLVTIGTRLYVRRAVLVAWLAGADLTPVGQGADPPVTFPDTDDARCAGRASGGG